MGILKIDERTEFIKYIGDCASIDITGGKYFMGRFKQRDKLIGLIKDIPMDESGNYTFQIQDAIIAAVGFKPITYTCWASGHKRTYSYDMPKEANRSMVCKTICVRLNFNKEP